MEDVSNLSNSFELNKLYVTILLVIITLILIWRTLDVNIRERALPPLPRYRLPVIGHLHLLDVDIRKSFRRFRQEVGDVYRLFFGSRDVVIISGLNNLRTALIKHGDCLLNRPSLFLVDQVTQNSGLVFSNGPKWKDHRRFTMSALRQLGMRRTETIVMNEIKELLSTLDDRLGVEFDPTEVIAMFATNVMTSLLIGKRFHRDDERFKTLIRCLEENMNDGGVAGIVNFFPVLAKLPGDLFKYKKILANNAWIHDFIDDSLDAISATDDDSFAALYLKELERLDTETLSRHDLVTTVADILFAGADDMTTAIRWCLAALVSYQDVQNTLYTDIQQYVAFTSPVSVTDRTQLASIEAFYLEVLRYCNIAVPTLPRCTSRDLWLNELLIPADTMVMPDFDSVLMDTDLWGDPETFRPDRHLNPDGTLNKDQGLVVFSIGKRNCAGEGLARMELFLLLASLVQTYNINSLDDLSLRQVDGQFGLSHRPHSFNIIVKKW